MAGFDNYYEQIKQLCVDKYGFAWDRKLSKSFLIKKFKDPDYFVDTSEMESWSEEQFLLNWLNKIDAFDSVLYKLHRHIDFFWERYSSHLNISFLHYLSKEHPSYSFQDLTKLVDKHKNFHTSPERVEEIEEKYRNEIKNEIRKIKKLQDTFGYKFRKYLNNLFIKYKESYKFLSSLETKKNIFRGDDDLADFQLLIFENGDDYRQEPFYHAQPTEQFEELHKIISDTSESKSKEFLIDEYIKLINLIGSPLNKDDTKLIGELGRDITHQDLINRNTLDLWEHYCEYAGKWLDKNFKEEWGHDWKENEYLIVRNKYNKDKKVKEKSYLFAAGGRHLYNEYGYRNKDMAKVFNLLSSLYKNIVNNDANELNMDNFFELANKEENLRPALFADYILFRDAEMGFGFDSMFSRWRTLELLENYTKGTNKDFNSFIKESLFSFPSYKNESL